MKTIFKELKSRCRYRHLVMILDGTWLILHYISTGGIGILVVGITMIIVTISDILDPDRNITQSDLYKSYANGFVDGCKLTYNRMKENESAEQDKRIKDAIAKLEAEDTK